MPTTFRPDALGDDPRIPADPGRHGLDSEGSAPTMSPDQVRELLRQLPGVDPAQVEAWLGDPHGFTFGPLSFIRVGDEYQVEILDHALGAITKENTKMKKSTSQPCLIVGPVLVHDGPAPRRPASPAGGVIEATLARKGEYLMRGCSQKFDGSEAAIQEHIAATLAENPGARFANEAAEPRLALTAKLDRVMGREPEPKILIAANAKPVERGRVAGTISKDAYRESIRSSEEQAQEVHDRVRARQAADPELKASTQRSDGSYYRADGTPHENLSMTRQPTDRDAAPGVGPAKVRLDELNPVMRKLVEGVVRRECAVNGCSEIIYSKTRRRCAAHAMSDGGQGLKSES